MKMISLNFPKLKNYSMQLKVYSIRVDISSFGFRLLPVLMTYPVILGVHGIWSQSNFLTPSYLLLERDLLVGFYLC